MKPHTLELTLSDWKQWCLGEGLPAFTAKQIYGWIYGKNNLDPLTFSNLSKELREKLAASFSWDLPEIDSHLISSDESEKFILRTKEGYLYEMVLMPYDKRVTLCVSSQVGCRMGCTFCQTGKMGFKRNLTAGEILGQLLLANQHHKVTNVVFMGMGEPLDNYEAVVQACSVMLDMGLSKSRVTISTCGVAPQIERLGKELPVRLAISLHSAQDEKRSAMMPINRKHNLNELKEALLAYPREQITFEYVMIDGKNDSLEDAKKLVSFIHGLKAKVNLIPVNPFPGKELKPSQQERLEAFQAYLKKRSIPAPVRQSRGQDISGACGQLAAKRQGELDSDPRTLRRQTKSSAT